MTREEFLEATIEKQVGYVNSRTIEGDRVIDVAEDIGLGSRTITKRFSKEGYKYNRTNKLYELLEDNDSMTRVIKGENDKSHTGVLDKKDDDKSHTTVLEKKVEDDKSHTDVFSSGDIEALKEIIGSVGDIKSMLEEDKADDKCHTIVIELPDNDEKRTTIRVSNGVWEDFEKFTDENNQYKKKDLLSMALLEYMNNHK